MILINMLSLPFLFGNSGFQFNDECTHLYVFKCVSECSYRYLLWLNVILKETEYAFF